MSNLRHTTPPIALPPAIDGSIAELPGSIGTIVIVGANGAGKSRFTERMIHDLGTRAFRLSAIEALYVKGDSNHLGSIERLWNREDIKSLGTSQPTTLLDRLMSMLIHDEMVTLINYKINRADNPKVKLPFTRLDTVIKLWQEIFPDNRILIENGRLLFGRRSDYEDQYSALRLSAGERAVIFYLGAATYLPKDAVVMVDSPEMFLHPTMMQAVWNRIQLLREDCTFVFTTHDLDFAASRTDAQVVWVRNFDAAATRWDYALLPSDARISDEIYTAILGARKPMLFIEGDGRNSIDSKLYPLIFKDFTVSSLGSCNKVIEATRTFNDLNAFHHLDSYGIVDRDRRDSKEVEYLRRKKVMVPEVAEVENILMLEPVIHAVATYRRKDAGAVVRKVKKNVIELFRHDMHQQALLHTRHRVKMTVEYRIDGRFNNINKIEEHMLALVDEINPRGIYEEFCREFADYISKSDYRSILRVYNQKSMLPASNVAGLCGLKNKQEYLSTILDILHRDSEEASKIVAAIRSCFNLPK